MNQSLLSLALITLLGGPLALSGQERSGLHLVVGPGPGAGGWDIEVDGSAEQAGHAAFTTNFELGAAVSPRVAVYYVQQTAWFNSTVTIVPGPTGGPTTPQRVGRILTHGLSGIGITYYLGNAPRSGFLTAGAGLAWWSQVFEESTDCLKVPLFLPCVDEAGIGITLGSGYQVTSRLAGRVTALLGLPGPRDGTRLGVRSVSAALSVGVEVRVF